MTDPTSCDDHQLECEQKKSSSGPIQLTTFEIRAMVDDPKTCENKLEEIEQNHYKLLVQRLVFGQTTAELKELIMVFEGLANLMKKRGDLSGKLVHYTDAAVIHQHSLTILEEKLLSDITELKIDVHERLADLQSRIFSLIGADLIKMRNVIEEADSYKALLMELRENVKDKYECAKKDSDFTRELFAVIAKEMKNFLALVYRDSENQMGTPPPCSYAVIGLGSMALQQITPYSDLEFAILVKNEDFRTDADPKVSDYFENLSHLAHFKVIGLGETEIAFSKYGVNTSHLVHVGVNFDLGGKTPLGRIGNDKPYNLVKTVDWMLHYVYNEEDKASHIDKNLPYILENVCYVYGDENLVTMYQTKIAEFLASRNKNDPANRLNCEIRACKLLEEGAVEFDYCRKTLDGLHREVAFKGDLDKLKPTLLDNEGFKFNVKQEIYRLPDRMIYNFGLFFNVRGNSGWDILDKLCVEQILSEQATVNLKRAMSFATLLRLRTYLHNRAQDEEMSIFPKQPDLETGILQLSTEDFSEDSGIFQYHFTALPLYEMLSKFCEICHNLTIEGKRSFFRESEFYKNDSLSNGLVFLRLARYEDAERCLEQAIELTEGKKKHLINLTLGDVYRRLGKWSKAIDSYQFCVTFLEHSDNAEWHPDLSIAHIRLGTAFNDNGQYEKAIECFQASLRVSARLNPSEAQIIKAGSLNSLGTAFQSQGKYEEAESYFTECLELKNVFHKNQPHLDMTFPLFNLGWVYLQRGNYEKAIECYEETLRIQKQFFGNEPHMDVASTLNSLAAVYQKKCQFVKAIMYLEMSLQIQRVIFKGMPHTCLAKSLNLLGWSHASLGQYTKAKEFLEESLQMERFINKGMHHPDVAAALNNLGSIYHKLGMFDQAIACFQENLELLKVIHENEDHPNMAATFNNFGMVYDSKADYEKALQNYEESMRIKKNVYKTDLHPDVATTMNNMGKVLQSMGRHVGAVEYFEKSLHTQRVVHANASHEDIATLLNNLGISFQRLNQFEKALAYHKQSLEMKEQIFGGSPHPSIAASHHNLGTTYRKMGRHNEAIVSYENALKIQKAVYGDGPFPEAGITLLNLGNTFWNIRRVREAISCYEESLRIQTAVYQPDGHPNIVLVLCNLGLALATLGEFSPAFQAINRAFIQSGKLDQSQLHKALSTIIRLFTSCYVLDASTTTSKINSCLHHGLDFTDSSTHLNSIEPGFTKENLIETYKLAAIFLHQTNSDTKKIVYDQLTDLTGVSPENINLWLGKDSWNPEGKNTRLTMAIANGDLQLVSTLVHLKCNIREPNNADEQASPLYCALGFFGQPVDMDIVKLLLANGADPSEAMCDGDTPMHMAHYTANREVTQLLLSHGGDINVQNGEGKSPLHCLVESEEVTLEMKEQFYRELYDVKLMDKCGGTAADYVSEHCSKLKALIQPKDNKRNP